MGRRYECKQSSDILTLESPIGELELESCQFGVHRLRLVGCRLSGDGRFQPDEKVPVCSKLKNGKRADSLSEIEKSCAEWLKSYFEKSFARADEIRPPICHLDLRSKGDNEDRIAKILQTLMSLFPAGSTTTYSDLAVRSGLSLRQCRLAARAMSSNHVMLMVPCHRVLPKSGSSVGNYSADGGREVKLWLLRHEGIEV